MDMKARAFFQAMVLVAALVGTWLLVLYKWQTGDHAKPQAPPPADAPQQDQTQPQTDAAEPQPFPSTPSTGLQVNKTTPPPDAWKDWFGYLETAQSPDQMRHALAQLATVVLQQMDPASATAWLLELIQSGADMPTGLAFQLREDRHLRGAHRLRAWALDWLAMLDPVSAAAIADDELQRLNTSLPPDVFAIHLRNLTLGELPQQRVQTRLQDSLAALLQHQPWLQQPTSAVAEAFDLAVYLDAAGHAQRLGDLMSAAYPAATRRAAAIALKRIAARQPAVIQTIIDTPFTSRQNAVWRADVLSQLYPNDNRTSALLDRYLLHPDITASEHQAFLDRFPNLDQTVSFNLLSSNILITETASPRQRLLAARDSVLRWLDTPAMQIHHAYLQTVLDRINLHLE
jgi:hypothetical protein